MDSVDFGLAVLVVLTSLVTALIALALMARFAPPRRVTWTPLEEADPGATFLFEDDELVDATPGARLLLSTGPEQMEALERLFAVLAPRFPGIKEQLASLGDVQCVEIDARDGAARLSAEWRSGLTRITVTDDAQADMPGHALALTAVQDEVTELRTALDEAPLLIWKEDAAGTVRWANSAYIALALQVDEDCDTLSWPLPRLFPDALAEPAEGDAPRLAIEVPREDGSGTNDVLRFEATHHRVRDGSVVFALPADRLAKAESALREFVQTLTKTFAHLPIGLAIFDKDRRLAVFNPALTDLSNLPPLFLSRRPTLFDFLDQLREVRRMPEPKDYRDWRRKISDLEQAASNGTHIETWTLPDGQTFRVTGRPHPDGAIAFLFQDITSEVSLTRRFRSELELSQSVVDSLDEAVAVFSPSQALVLSNTAYDLLWDCDEGLGGEASLSPTTLSDAAAMWAEACTPAPLWASLADFAGRTDGRAPWRQEVRMRDGRGLICRVAPLAGNAILVGFTVQSAPLAETAASGPEVDTVLAPAAPGARQSGVGG